MANNQAFIITLASSPDEGLNYVGHVRQVGNALRLPSMSHACFKEIPKGILVGAALGRCCQPDLPALANFVEHAGKAKE